LVPAGCGSLDPSSSARYQRAQTEKYCARAPFVASRRRAVTSALPTNQDLFNGDAPRRRIQCPGHLPPLDPEWFALPFEQEKRFGPPLVLRLCHWSPASGMGSRAAFPRARPSLTVTFPSRRARATCRPSTSTNRNDPRAHLRTSATQAIGAGQPLCRVTHLP
jgi:hypothetical protein